MKKLSSKQILEILAYACIFLILLFCAIQMFIYSKAEKDQGMSDEELKAIIEADFIKYKKDIPEEEKVIIEEDFRKYEKSLSEEEKARIEADFMKY